MCNIDYLEIYKLYIDRLKLEGDWIWSRFKFYVTLNNAAFGAIGLIFREIKFDASDADIVRIVVVFGIGVVGRLLAVEWANVTKQGIYWENVFTWHVAQIEKEINMPSVDLYQYIDSYEKTKEIVDKDGMEYITVPMKSERKDPLFSNLSVSITFKIMFEVIVIISLISAVSASIGGDNPMNWLIKFAPALEAIAAFAALLVTLLLAFLTWQYVRLTRELTKHSETQAALSKELLKQTKETTLELRQRKATALKELARRVLVTTRHLDSFQPNGPMSKKFSYLTEGDIAVFDTLAQEVSVETAKTASLLIQALRTVTDQTTKAKTDQNWVPDQQEMVDWKGALETIGTDIPQIEQTCTTVLLQRL